MCRGRRSVHHRLSRFRGILSTSFRGIEPVPQILHQVVRVLDAHREPEQPVGDTGGGGLITRLHPGAPSRRAR